MSMSANLRDYLRLFRVQMRMSLLQALQYRVGFWTEGILGMLWSCVGVVPLIVAIEHQGDVAGWNAWELMLLTGCFFVVSGLFSAILQPALMASMDHIRRGTLDYILLRPADSLVLCFVMAFRPWRAIESITGVILVVLSLWQLRPAWEWYVPFELLGMMLAAIVSLHALSVFMLSLSFKAMQLQNLTYLFESLLDFARWPISVFRGPLKALFTFVIPLAVMTSFPAQALLGRLEMTSLWIAFLISLGLWVLARLVWRNSLRNYTSASS